MKNQQFNSKSATFEDLVFEGRNKSYGAYDLNNNCRKYLIIAFFASLLGVSSAIAVPFFKAFKGGVNTTIGGGVTVTIRDLSNEIETPSVPPPPPPPDAIKQVVYLPPVVVENADESEQIVVIDELINTKVNIPVPLTIEPVKDVEPSGIDEIKEAPLYVEENATFMGGDVIEFRNWIIKNITYPTEAIDNGVFGKVIVEFTIDTNGEITNIKFIRSLDPTVDNETKRVISSSPLWSPAKMGGKPTRQRFIIPISFQMQ